MSKLLATGGAMHLRDIAQRFGVSQMTIRRDVAQHADKFVCLGGHIAHAAGGASGYTIESEKDHFAGAKRAACRAALCHVRDHDTLFIDCGTTLLALAHLIPDELHLTVICYSLGIAEILKKKPNVRLLVLGGWYVPSSDSFGGEETLAALADKGINTAFISAGGVDDVYGVSCWNPHEKAVKQKAMKIASRCYLVVDSSKLGQRRPIQFARLNAFTGIVTERNWPGKGVRR